MNPQQINELEPIENDIGKLVDLRKVGNCLVGMCPFHDNTKTPSFVVWPVTQTWRCFGACKDGGDRISFHMKRTGLTFKETCEDLSKGHVIPDNYTPKPKVRPKTTVNDSFYPAKDEYDNASNPMGNEYTKRKLIPIEVLEELKARQVDDKILIPMFGGGKIKGFQDIQPSRDYLPEKITRGNTASAILATLKNGVPILLGEGLATCVSAYLAMEKSIPTVIAFNSSRLHLVTKVLRKRYPDSDIYILVDVDASQTGQKSATKICKLVANVYSILPIKELPSNVRSFDFSDLHINNGLDAVAQIINKAITLPPCSSGACKPGGMSKVLNDGGKLKCLNCGQCYKEIPHGVNVLNRDYMEEYGNE